MAAPSLKKSQDISSFLREAGAKAKLQAEDNIRAAAPVGSLTIRDPRAEDPRIRRPKVFSVLDYIEQPWGLAMHLYPVQKFIVKLYYYIPLDNTVRNIQIPDMLNTRVLYRFTEAEYLRFLHDEGRCNIGDQDHERRDLLLAIGRRAGKTTLSGIFASYEVYRLLNCKF